MVSTRLARIIGFGALMALGSVTAGHALEVTAGSQRTLTNTPMAVRQTAFENAVQAAMNELNNRIATCGAAHMLYAPSSTTPAPNADGCIALSEGGDNNQVCAQKSGFYMPNEASADADGCVALQMRSVAEVVNLTGKTAVFDHSGKYTVGYTLNLSELASVDKSGAFLLNVSMMGNPPTATWPAANNRPSLSFYVPNLTTSVAQIELPTAYICVNQCGQAADRWTRSVFASYNAANKIISVFGRCENGCGNFIVSSVSGTMTYSKLVPIAVSASSTLVQ